MTTPPVQHWFKSSYSGGSGTECVECAHVGEATLVRDSKKPEGPTMTVGHSAWTAFVHALGLSVIPG
ncbi:DUF397 domain-containing protein [Streptomyces spinosirectus]|jgi:hypothetical protein|uniref:DUF397 domain-containing protein n=1 Tax=Streptomyces TaxID=1883 RepID=UPI000D3D1058|nr:MULTISPECIES: DUF397 domain-containing protein [Streptomyces]PTM91166.1 uncharacterized protein DUF397 [Streptomyces sp. VMFN-G11Ma]UIR20157.1 DUF397 domain-containing protein [Streptomyces spinosirectus]